MLTLGNGIIHILLYMVFKFESCKENMSLLQCKTLKLFIEIIKGKSGLIEKKRKYPNVKHVMTYCKNQQASPTKSQIENILDFVGQETKAILCRCLFNKRKSEFPQIFGW